MTRAAPRRAEKHADADTNAGGGVRLFSSLKMKFTLSYAVMIAVVLILMNTYFLIASRDMIFASKQAFVRSQAVMLETALRDIERLTGDSAEQVISRLDISGLSYIKITDAGGGVIFELRVGGADDIVADEFTAEHGARVFDGYGIYSLSFKDGAFSVGAFLPVTRGGTITGSVFVSEIDREQGAILIGLQNTIKNISIVIVLLSSALIVFILWTVMRRITSILRAIVSVRAGEYGYRIKMSGSDELAMLGREFDSLADKLHETEDIRRRFVADASHELKTPLASIRLLSDSILQNEDIDGDTMREFVADIGEEAERLTRTTEKLLSLTKLDGGVSEPPEPVDMREVVSATLRMLRPLALSEGITIDASLDGGCTALLTEDSLHQIVFNLVENALKYNTRGGSVFTHLRREDGEAVLTVEDTGIGVPEDDLRHIFDRFYRVDKARSRAYGGSGLGLSIVRDTVKAFGGTISAARRDSGGMTFEVRFPLYI
ncbi:MAG: HAMP domain-containing histidine kinase [Oscillospiraceae bacterium]|jgi:signal transduction histidine kinase|nr:HAMP domain-containing histidine kinase [Oscillospiraceae bacterium]